MSRLSSGPKLDLSCWVGCGRKRTGSFAELHPVIRVVECQMKRPSFDEKQMRAGAFDFIRLFAYFYIALDSYLDNAP